MSFESRVDDFRLSVLLDLRHPLACLALPPAVAFSRSLAGDVNWLPLVVPPLEPPLPAGPDDDRGTRHRRLRAQALVREIQTYAASQGLVIRDLHRRDDVELAHLAWLWVREHRPECLPRFLEDVFRDYWAGALDVASREDVAARVGAAGSDGAAFLRWAGGEGPAVAATLQADLRERGLLRVPAYVVEGEIFYGRQHLPMIRWILGDRSGPRPG